MTVRSVVGYPWFRFHHAWACNERLGNQLCQYTLASQVVPKAEDEAKANEAMEEEKT